MKKILILAVCMISLASACDKKSTTEDPQASENTNVAEQKVEEQKAEEKPAEEPAAAPSTPESDSPLMNPIKATLEAPDKFKVKFVTTKGDFIVDVDKKLSPNGANRFYNLAKIGFYNDVAFFRVIDGFMAQFGMHGNPAVTKAWSEATIPDDPVKGTNERGAVTFAKTGLPNSRTTQLFINFGNNASLDKGGFAPFGKVEGDGMKVVDALYNGYGEGQPNGKGPSQSEIREKGNEYLKAQFPELDYVKSVEVIE